MIAMFPMGGIGKRFKEAGYTTPKPLLQLGERCLIEWSVNSLSLLRVSYHYLVTMEVMTAPGVDGLLPAGCWHVLLEATVGPLQTILQAPGCLSSDDELLICDCDSTMDADELVQAIEVFRKSQAAGGVTIRRTTDSMCSFAEVTSDWWVTQTREKDVFSPWSTTGPYWFRSAKQFLVAAQQAANAHYVSINPVYNYLKGKTKAMPVTSFKHFGTPDAYEAAVKEASIWTAQS